jgi:hypothetical protein
MTNIKLALTAALGALFFAMAGYAAASEHGASVKDRIVIAADDSATSDDESESEGSAKMGEEEGAYEGDEQGSAPENDTQKLD